MPTIGGWVVRCGPGFCYLEQSADICEQLAFKISALVCVHLKGCAEPGDELIDKFLSSDFSCLFWYRGCFDPTSELVNDDKNVLVTCS